MSTLTQSVREVALEAGADLVCFAPISRFEKAPAELYPRTIFPQARPAVPHGQHCAQSARPRAEFV